MAGPVSEEAERLTIRHVQIAEVARVDIDDLLPEN
jgi:hypothetical protein